MAQNTTITATPDTWTELTNSNVTKITFQNGSAYHGLISGTTGTTAPASTSGAIRYNPGQGERNVAMADLFPGITAVRVWVLAEKPIDIMVSHA